MADLSGVRALTFDVFGTVVDWRSSVIGELESFGARHAVETDWGVFADRWRREGYAGGMRLVRDGKLPFQSADSLHRRMLDILFAELGVEAGEDEVADLNRAWHRLAPWPDSAAGLARLRARFIVSTLSNGNVELLVNMAKFGGLPWDCVLSAEITGAFKPDAQCYQRAAELLGCESSQVMMVAAHQGDLLAAAKTGMRTAFVPRPKESGPHHPAAPHPRPLVRHRRKRLPRSGVPARALAARCRPSAHNSVSSGHAHDPAMRLWGACGAPVGPPRRPRCWTPTTTPRSISKSAPTAWRSPKTLNSEPPREAQRGQRRDAPRALHAARRRQSRP